MSIMRCLAVKRNLREFFYIWRFETVTKATLTAQKPAEFFILFQRADPILAPVFAPIGRPSYFQFTLRNPNIFSVLLLSTTDHPTCP